MPVVTRVTARNEDLDPLAPQREAALFYGYFFVVTPPIRSAGTLMFRRSYKLSC